MNLKKLALGSLLALVAAAAVGWQMLDKETRGFVAHFPTNRDVLFWQNRSAMLPSVRSTGSPFWSSTAWWRPVAHRLPCHLAHR